MTSLANQFDPIEMWKIEFSAYYHGLTKTNPIFLQGQAPLLDIKAFLITKELDTAWFMYPLESYPPEYWELIELMDFNGFEAQVSTAEQLSHTIGIPVWDRNIPSIWIMHLEK